MVDVYVTSAFSKNNKGGNKAGIILNMLHLEYSKKLEISKKLGYSETAFVQNSDIADFKLQYFTTTEEVPLCGHATIAAFSTLMLLGLLDKQNYKVETKAGILNIQIKENGLVFMEQNCPLYLDILAPDVFERCIDKNFIDSSLPIQIVSTGLNDIMLPVCSKEHLEKLSPDLKMITKLSKEKNVVGIHIFALSEEPGITAICRNFAPLYGINEEPATGTSSCALACYLFKYYEKKSSYIFEQGYNLGRISRIIVNITYHKDIIDSVYVGGYGHLLGKKSLSV